MKILITGNVGSGKTTLSKKLSNLYNIPLFSIDNIVHDDIKNKKRTSKEQISIINKINRENKEYIIEGVLRSNLEFICNFVDTIVIIDLDKKVLRRRVKLRYFKQRIGIEKADYTVDREMLDNMYKWQDEYDYDRLRKIIFKYHKKIIYLKNKREIKKYLIAIEKDM